MHELESLSTIDPDVPRAGVKRRTMLLTVAAAAGFASVGDLMLAGGPALADPPPESAAGVVAEARSYMGDSFLEVRAVTTGTWATYSGDWCAWFMTWCLRGLGFGRLTYVDQLFAFGDIVSTPQVGDLVLYGNSSNWYHTGIVSKFVGGAPWLIDGNGTNNGTLTPPFGTYVQERAVWNDPHVYVRPSYGSDPQKKGNSGMATLYYKASTRVGSAVDGTLAALAGDSPGTPANWLETTTGTMSTAWANTHGSWISLTDTQWSTYKAAYQSAITTA